MIHASGRRWLRDRAAGIVRFPAISREWVAGRGGPVLSRGAARSAGRRRSRRPGSASPIESERTLNRHFSAAALILAVATPAAAAEDVEGPIYKSWSGSKIGTAVTIKSVTVQGGTRAESTLRYRAGRADPGEGRRRDGRDDQGGRGPAPAVRPPARLPLAARREEGRHRQAPGGVGAGPGDARGPRQGLRDPVVRHQVPRRGRRGDRQDLDQPRLPGHAAQVGPQGPAADKVTTLEVIEFKQP